MRARGAYFFFSSFLLETAPGACKNVPASVPALLEVKAEKAYASVPMAERGERIIIIIIYPSFSVTRIAGADSQNNPNLGYFP